MPKIPRSQRVVFALRSVGRSGRTCYEIQLRDETLPVDYSGYPDQTWEYPSGEGARVCPLEGEVRINNKVVARRHTVKRSSEFRWRGQIGVREKQYLCRSTFRRGGRLIMVVNYNGTALISRHVRPKDIPVLHGMAMRTLSA